MKNRKDRNRAGALRGLLSGGLRGGRCLSPVFAGLRGALRRLGVFRGLLSGGLRGGRGLFAAFAGLRGALLSLLLCAAALPAGCGKEPATEPGGETPSAGGMVTAEVTLTPEFVQQIDVKSVAGVDENVVKNVWMIQLNSSGTALLQPPRYITSVAGSGSSYKITAAFVQQACMVYFIANTHRRDLFDATNATTTAQVEAATLAVTAEANLVSEGCIPMSGEWRGTPDAMFGISGVSLTRAVAKVTFNLSADIPVGHTFTLKSVKVKRVPSVVQYFRSDPAATPYPATTVGWLDEYAVTTYNETLGTPGRQFVWYLPENMRGIGTGTDPKDKTAAKAPAGQGDYCTYVEVSGVYNKGDNSEFNGTGVVTSFNATYRIFFGANKIVDYNLQRNTHYTVTTTITGTDTSDTRIDVAWGLDYTDNGAPWFYAAQADVSGTMNWEVAEVACPTGWRLPTQRELMLMWVHQTGLGTFDDYNYWTSTVDTHWGASVWCVNLSTGGMEDKGKSMSYKVRCVRDSGVTKKYPYVMPDGKTIVSRDAAGGVKSQYIHAKWMATPSHNEQDADNNRVAAKFEVAINDTDTIGAVWNRTNGNCDTAAGWRRPTQRELIQMYVLQDQLTGITIANGAYWSATEVSDDNAGAWSFLWFAFPDGRIERSAKSSTGPRERCVKDVD